MQKVLGQDIKDLDERRQFLLDNADEVVEMDYSKAFDADELAKKKTNLPKNPLKSTTSTRPSKTTRQNLPRCGSIPQVRTKQNHYVLFKEKEIRQSEKAASKPSYFGKETG